MILNPCKLDELPQATKDYLREHSMPLQTYNIELKYDYWNASKPMSIIYTHKL